MVRCRVELISEHSVTKNQGPENMISLHWETLRELKQTQRNGMDNASSKYMFTLS